MVDSSHGMPVGNAPNFARNMMDLKRSIRTVTEDIYTTEIVVVQAYNFAAQTVDVLLKSDPKVPVIKNVPIASGGELRHIRSFKTIEDGDEDPTVGIIAYPRIDGRNALLDFERLTPISGRRHTNFTPIYLADIPVISELPFPNHFENANKDAIGPKDTGFQHSSGSFVLFKGNGDVIIKSKGKVYIGGLEQKAGSFDKVAKGAGAPLNSTSKKVFVG